MNLFVYGTLLDEEIMQRVCGTSFTGIQAVLSGYRCRKVVNQRYPAIRPCPSEQVAGMLYLDVSASVLKALDRYEGDQYQRCSLQVDTASERDVSAEVYVLTTGNAHLLSAETWDLGTFLTRDKPSYLEQL